MGGAQGTAEGVVPVSLDTGRKGVGIVKGNVLESAALDEWHGLMCLVQRTSVLMDTHSKRVHVFIDSYTRI